MLHHATRSLHGRTVVYDTFTDPDATAIASHAPNFNRASGTYRTFATFGGDITPKIQSNTVRGTAGSSRSVVVLIESSISDAIITADINKNGTTSSNGGTGIAFRYTSTNNGYVIDYLTTTGLRLNKNTGTSGSAIATAAFTFSTTTTYRFKVVLAGSSIKVYVNDTLYIDTTDSTYNGTEHGVGLLASSTPLYSWADNLLIQKG